MDGVGFIDNRGRAGETALEGPQHRKELELVTQTYKLFRGGKDVILAGTAGAKVQVPAKLSARLPPIEPASIDVIVRQKHLESFDNVKEIPVVDLSRSMTQVSGRPRRYFFTPFRSQSIGIDGVRVSTESTGFGGLPIDESVFTNARSVQLKSAGFDVKVPSEVFTITQFLDSVTYKSNSGGNMVPSIVALITNRENFDMKEIAGQVVDLIERGGKRVRNMLNEMQIKDRKSAMRNDGGYIDYAEIVTRTVPNQLIAQINPVQRVVGRIEVSKEETARLISTLADALRNARLE